MDDEKMSAKLVLSNKEINNIMTNADKVNLFEKDKQVIELKNQLLSVQNALLDAQKEVVKRDKIIIDYHSIKLEEELNTAKEKSRDELMEISKHHEGLKGKKWGYNPETGEIIIDEELQTTPK